MTYSDVLSSLSLALATYAVWQTHRFNEKQNRLIESQEGLNLLTIAKGQSDAADEKKADLGASFVKLGSSSYRLKIWNKGKSVARHVRVEFPDGNDVVLGRELEEKFPLESLEPHQAVELIAAVMVRTKRKHTIKLMWSDDFQKSNEKTVYPTI